MTGRHVWLEVTPRCNAHCRYCYNVWRAPGGGYAAPEPSRADLEAVLRAVLERLEPEALTFSGGEPLLREDLETLAFLARRHRSELELQVTTNGTLLTRKRAATLRRAGISHALIPLLSDRRETQTGLMGLDTFDDACRALLNARAAGMVACAVFVATRRNLPEMTGAFQTALALGADEWMFLRFLPGGTGLANRAELLPDPKDLADALAEADRLGRRYGLPVTCGEPLLPAWLAGRHLDWVRFARCGAGLSRLAVDPAGRVRPCEQDPKVLGNVLAPAFRAPEAPAPACAGCRLADPAAA